MIFRPVTLLIFLIFTSVLLAENTDNCADETPVITIPFITTWQTDNPGNSADNQIIIPTFSGETYNYDVDWGDATTSTGETGNATHTYATPGTYTVTITGTFPRIYFNGELDSRKLLTIENWGNNQWTSMENAFEECYNLEMTNAGIDNPDLTGVTSMANMFRRAILFNGDITGWNVSNVTDMNNMFTSANSFNQDISSWDVGNVTDMSYMFLSALTFDQNIGGWNVSNVNNMQGTFQRAADFNQDLDAWNTANVTTMESMFADAADFNQDLNNWNVANVTTMERMFESADRFNGTITAWDVGNVENFHRTFREAADFNMNIGAWNVISATNMSLMFQNANSFDQNIGNWNVSSVTDMSGMFSVTDVFNQDIGSWDVSNVTNMADMFEAAQLFNQDIGGWNVGNVTNMSQMFRVLSSQTSFFDQDIGGWNVSSVTDMNGMFTYARNFNQNISNWNVSNVTNMAGMFFGASAFNQDIGTWDVSNVTDMGRALVSGPNVFIGGMFENAIAFDQNLENWNVENLADADHMFDGATLSTANYDALLIGWNAQNLLANLDFHGGNSQFCAGEAARNTMTSTDNWTIVDAGLGCPSPDFVTTWQTTTANESITIPTTGPGYNYTVDWGDGSTPTTETGDATHTYAAAGTYTVSITGDFPRIFINTNTGSTALEMANAAKIQTIEQWGDNIWSSMASAFEGAINLQGNFTDVPDLSNVTSLNHMFRNASSFNSAIDNWDTSNITDMGFTFANANSFNQNIGNWNVNNVTNMEFMFANAGVFDQEFNELEYRKCNQNGKHVCRSQCF